MRNYEVTFIVDPVLSSDEIKATAQTYVDMLNSNGNKLIHADEMGLRQLAYPIKKRSSGVYYCLEFSSENGLVIAGLELALKRDERIMRFLSVSLDKHGVKYNEDKRSGKIGQSKKRFRPITTLEPVSATPQAAVAESSAPKAPAEDAKVADAVEAPVMETPVVVDEPIVAQADPVEAVIKEEE
jgi:small subunit ribosomal protein S6